MGESDRNWDLVVSYFGDDPDLFKTADVTRIDGKGPKWPGLHEVFAAHPEFLNQWSYLALSKMGLPTTSELLGRRQCTVCRETYV